MTIKHIRNRQLSDFSTDKRVLFVIAIALPVAIAAMCAGLLLLQLIRLCTNLAYFGQFSFAELRLEDASLGLWAVGIPVIGSLLIGLIARYGSEKIRGHGIPEAIEAILLGRSRLDAKVAVLKPLSSAIAIGTGGPFGAEGPIIMTGGAIGSLIAQALPVSDNERKTLLVAGAAAGMTTVFGTPIAAIMLAVELLLFEWSPRSFIPVVVAATVAQLGRSLLGMGEPLFPFDGAMLTTLAGFAGWIAIGIAAGLLSGLLTQLVYACEDGFQRLPIHWMWWPMIGGLVVGIGGLIDPRALGVGYENISAMLDGQMLGVAAITLLVVKAVIWSVALGSGTSGGVLAPLLIMGGAMGAALGGFLPDASPGFWALLAMAAMMGGTMRAPLTATFFAVELTGNVQALLPLIVACVTAHAMTVLLMKRSILTEKIARRGHHIVREYRVDPFELTHVRDVMTSDVISVPAAMTLHGAVRFLTSPQTRHPSFPVVDQQGNVLGIVDPPSVLAWRRAGRHRNQSLGELLQGARITLAYPDEYLAGLVDKLVHANVAHLPVVSRTDGSLIGYIGWKDLMRVRQRLATETHERATLMGPKRRRTARQ
ncbi:chloride channel protein [Advenella sp. S44]|uniref:chloride channel protein n=1 Tax=Advenella sp. S44 TaxID=1982755 RepID=UPI000C2A7B3A|nr:chloride channel protein [Advenella sp. S44]PJX22057.1 chloride channel protein [Advenella sp. S44]